jgi:hypothetical protein
MQPAASRSWRRIPTAPGEEPSFPPIGALPRLAVSQSRATAEGPCALGTESATLPTAQVGLSHTNVTCCAGTRSLSHNQKSLMYHIRESLCLTEKVISHRNKFSRIKDFRHQGGWAGGLGTRLSPSPLKSLAKGIAFREVNRKCSALPKSDTSRKRKGRINKNESVPHVAATQGSTGFRGKYSQTFIARTDKEITKASGPVTCLIRLSARRKALRCKANIHSLASFGYWNGKAIRNKKRLEADTRPVKRAGATPLRVLVDLTHRPPLVSSKQQSQISGLLPAPHIPHILRQSGTVTHERYVLCWDT